MCIYPSITRNACITSFRGQLHLVRIRVCCACACACAHIFVGVCGMLLPLEIMFTFLGSLHCHKAVPKQQAQDHWAQGSWPAAFPPWLQRGDL